MALTKEQQEMIREWARGKSFGLLKPCIFCGGQVWVIGPIVRLLTVPSVAKLSDITLGGETMPALPIVCSGCGNTLFINLITSGLLDKLKALEPEGGSDE